MKYDGCFIKKECSNVTTLINVSESDRELNNTYHRRLGHISSKYLRLLPKVIQGVPSKLYNVPLDFFYNCEICIRAKSTHSPHTVERHRAVRVFEIVCTDIVGPLIESRTGDKYIINFVDDFSGFVVTYCIKSKDAALSSFKDYISKANSLFPGIKVAFL